MKRLLWSALLALACHEGPRQSVPTPRTGGERTAREEAVSPLEPAPPSGADGPVFSEGAGASSGGAQLCQGRVFLRVRNASSVDFDSAQIDGIEFGAVRVGAVSEYKQVEPGRCVYRYGSMSVRSGTQRFVVFPIDFVGERPLKPGHYTQALTTEPASDPRTPGGIRNEIAREPAAQ